MTNKIVVSDKYQLIKQDLISLVTGLGITLLGAALTYITEYVAKCDYGELTPVIVALWALVANTVRKFITEKKYIQ